MFDLATYVLRHIPNVWTYQKFEETSFSSVADASGNGHLGSYGNFNSMSSSYPGGTLCTGTLLNQCRKTYGIWANQFYNSGIAQQTVVNYTNQDWTLLLGGYKPIDFTIPHLIWSQYNTHNLYIARNTNGSLTINIGTDTTSAHQWTSASGLLTQWALHMVAISYTSATGVFNVYVGDWNGNFKTATSTALTLGGSAGTIRYGFGPTDATAIGLCPSGCLPDDALLDDLAIVMGHAITSAEAQECHRQCGYTQAIDYPITLSHRSSPFNRGYAGPQTLDANSAGAAADVLTLSPASGTPSPSINYYNYTEPLYIVSGNYRKNPANCRPVQNMRYDTTIDGELTAQFVDVPIPYVNAGAMASAFGPSPASDSTCAVYCPDTDEFWDLGVFTTDCFITQVTLTNGSNVLTFPQQTNPAILQVGATITTQASNGVTGLPAGATITAGWAGASTLTCTMSAPATATSTGLIFITPASGNGYRTVYGNKANQFSLNPGHFIYPRTSMGARSAGVPSCLGLVTYKDALDTGPIKHALALEISSPKSSTWVWPAQRTDGGTSIRAVTGMLFRLKQDAATTTRINALTNAFEKRLAQAAQTYGLILLDSTHYNTVINAQDQLEYSTIMPTGPYTVPFAGLGPYNNGVLANFPWDALEVVSSNSINPEYAGATIPSAPVVTSATTRTGRMDVSWTDQPMSQFYTLYVKSGSTYSAVMQSEFTSLTYWAPLSGETTFALTARNGGGEGPKSADFSPVAYVSPVRSARRSRLVTA